LILGGGSASQAQYFDWAVKFGGSGNSIEAADKIHVDPLGNIYLAGQYSEDVDFDLGPDTFLLGANDQNMFVVKYTSELDFFWAVRFGGAPGARVWPGDITADNAGNVYATGYFEQTVDFDPGPGVMNLTATAGAQDAFVVKLSPTGGLIWARRLGGPSFDEGHAIALDASNNVYTAGHFSGTSDFNPGGGVFNLTSGVGMYAAYVSKLDGSGNFLWAQAFTGPGGAFCFDLAFGPGPGGDLHLAGTFSGTIDFDPGGGVTNLTSAGNGDAYVAKLDVTGALVWARPFGGTQWVSAAGVAVNPTGVFVTGQFAGTADFDPGLGVLNMTAGGTQDGFIVKLENSGALAWARQLGGAGSAFENPIGLALDAAGEPHVSGTFSGTADFDPGAGTFSVASSPGGGDDVFAVELDGAGNFLWAVGMGGRCLGHACECCAPGDDRALGMTVDPSGHTYTVGYFRGIADFDPANNWTFLLSSQALSDDMFLSKLSPMPLSGAAPDGASRPGVMLTLQKGVPPNIIFRWGPSCRAADERYAVYEGTLGNFTSHVPLSTCTVFATSISRTPGAGDRYYLVVPSEGTVEGSYGVDSNGTERASSASACHPQSVEVCPP